MRRENKRPCSSNHEPLAQTTESHATRSGCAIPSRRGTKAPVRALKSPVSNSGESTDMRDSTSKQCSRTALSVRFLRPKLVVGGRYTFAMVSKSPCGGRNSMNYAYSLPTTRWTARPSRTRMAIPPLLPARRCSYQRKPGTGSTSVP